MLAVAMTHGTSLCTVQAGRKISISCKPFCREDRPCGSLVLLVVASLFLLHVHMHADYRNGALGTEAIPSAFSTGVYPLSGTNERPCPGYVRFFFQMEGIHFVYSLAPGRKAVPSDRGEYCDCRQTIDSETSQCSLFFRSQVDLFLITMNDDYRKTPIWVICKPTRTQPNKPVP
jgi:hypothetical protein